MAVTGEVGAARAHYGLWPYVQMARIDHWFKNAFMLAGVILALFVEPALMRLDVVPVLLLALVSTCLVASSNYVLNEMLDAPYDRKHPVKKHRPAAAEQVRRRYALAEWLALGVLGIGLGLLVNRLFAATALFLWVMGVVYNVKPIRSKEIPYLDVLSESINNPIRLLLGWLPLIQDKVPPLSLVFSYWMVGAFFMALKRFAEYRTIGDRATAIRYRRSFKYYDEERLLVSVFFYAIAAALFAGVFVVRYHLELILGIPLGAGFLAWYLKLGLQPGSPVQNPERLYRERGFLVYTIACLVVFVLLMFVRIPALYEAFNVELVKTSPLWVIER
ncbi:MAG TPA: UbiA family prenyltransferase [Myxococcota bacterium]|jgi:4-hydroxybenzoate polyprenyltransferase|nr:UbiA family prenyltransferase [Myxococcota bacterium]